MLSSLRKGRFFLVLWITAAAMTHAADDPDSFNVRPDRIQIGTFYHVSEINITAQIPQNNSAVILLKGKEDDVILNRKGKVAAIWLNVSRITAHNAPQVYILASSRRLANIAPAATRDELGIGLGPLQKHIQFSSDKPLSGKEFNEFIKLKSSVGAYDTSGQIDLKSASDGTQLLSARLSIPPSTPPGNYNIVLYLFNQGELVRQDTARISLERAGLVRMLTNLSIQYAAIYGLLAIFVALAAGIIVGLIFSSFFR